MLRSSSLLVFDFFRICFGTWCHAVQPSIQVGPRLEWRDVLDSESSDGAPVVEASYGL